MAPVGDDMVGRVVDVVRMFIEELFDGDIKVMVKAYYLGDEWFSMEVFVGKLGVFKGIVMARLKCFCDMIKAWLVAWLLEFEYEL